VTSFPRGLIEHIRIHKFAFDEPFLLHEADHPLGSFLLDFFNSAAVRDAFPVVTPERVWNNLKDQPPVVAVEVERLAATLTTLDVFDKLEQRGLNTFYRIAIL